MTRKFLDLTVFQDQPLTPYTSSALERRLNGGPRPIGLIVGHTHWDREWYLPFEGFRARLVATLDSLLDQLENDPAFRCFVLDGQAIILEDYLQVQPEAEFRLRALLRAGRLKAGPWYTSVDTFLPDPEAIVRNLQLGRWAVRRLEGQPMPCGYLPDTFGFMGQLPQLLRHFGIENAFVWRGLHPENDATACWWEAPDGSRILALRAAEGYSEAAKGVVNPDRFLEEDLPRIMERYRREKYPDRLFIMGSDHFITRSHLPQLAEEMSRRLDRPVETGSIEEMAALVRAYGQDLPTIRGEQRHSCLVINPASVCGTRIPLKQANQRVEALLLGQAEPLQALAELAGAGSDRAHLRWAWRLLAQNQPHDSLPGCSIDAVHREMVTRFERVTMVATDVLQRGAKRLASALNPAARGELGAIGLVGLAGGRERLRLRLHAPETGFPPFRLTTQAGREVPYAILAQGQEIVQYHRLQDAFATAACASYVNLVAPAGWVEDQRVSPRMYTLPWLDIEIEVDVPRAGYEILRIEKANKAAVRQKRRSLPGATLENGQIRVEARAAGLFLEDLSSGQEYGPIYFSHAGERGDEYTACPLPEAPVIFAPLAGEARLVGDGLRDCLRVPVRAAVPARLSANRQKRLGQVRLEGWLEVRVQGKRADLRLSLVNRAKNYDLRLIAHVPNTVRGFAGSPYGVEERPSGPVHEWPGAPQQDLPDFPFRGWLAAQGPQGGLALLARGLYEAAIRPSGAGLDMALTLLRGVDYLSREDLATRPGGAGPAIPTPEAQCLGPQNWELALLPFSNEQADELPALAEQFLRPLAHFPVQWSAGQAPGQYSAWQGDEELVISALRPASSFEGAMLHAHNPTHQARAALIAGEKARLDETPVQGENTLRPFEVAGWRITRPGPEQ